MDKEKAIKILRNKIECLSHSKCSDCPLDKVCDQLRTPSDSEYIAAYGMAIEALSAEPCDDAISRQAAFEQINCWIGSGEYRYTNATDYLTKRMSKLPPVTPKQKMGQWIEGRKEVYKCSACGNYALEWGGKLLASSYCPWCGAKMEESKVQADD